MQILTRYLIQTAAAMAGVIGFSVIFHAPKSEYIACGLTGTAGWIAYCIFTDCGLGIIPANFLATVILTLVARTLVIIRRNPITVYLVPGIFPLVPGAGIYYTAYYLFMNFPTTAVHKGVETLKVAGAITLGILFGSFIAHEWFRRQREFRRTLKD